MKASGGHLLACRISRVGIRRDDSRNNLAREIMTREYHRATQVKARLVRVGQEDALQGKARQIIANHCKARQDKTEQSKARQSKV